jgi:hypothetical protein
VKIKIVCKHCHQQAFGEPFWLMLDHGEQWELDLSDMYCICEPSRHPDTPNEFEVTVCQT